MKYTDLVVASGEQPLSLGEFGFPDIISPSLHKGKMAQTHYLFRASDPSVVSLRVHLKDAEANCRRDLEEAKNKQAVNQAEFPYGQTKSQWWEYCLAPHSYLPLRDGTIQVGLNFFNRFLHIDFHSRSAQLIDPGVGHEMLSTTNWFDHHKDEIWFASWPLGDTVRRLSNPRANVRVSIWKYSVRDGHLDRLWQGDLGDSLHQLSVSPDRRFLILTELGLRPEEAISPGPPDQYPSAWKKMLDKGLVSSKILVLNLKTGQEWRLSVQTAGHVEFDPDDHEICYLSEHNIGLVGPRVGIFGTGAIKKIRLKKTGPEWAGEFTHPCFHRVTTHIVFRHQGKTLIGVSGYPDTIFIIKAASMKLYKTIRMEPGELVETSVSPHLCRRDSYGIAASRDGEALFVAGTGFVHVARMDEGRFVFKKEFDDYDDDSCFTGHLGMRNIISKE